MEKFVSIVLVFLICFLTSCSSSSQNSSKNNDSTKNATLKQGDTIEFSYTPNSVDEFFTALQKDLKDKTTEISQIQMHFKIKKKDVYNITPENSEEKTGYKVFKDISNDCAFLYSENEIVPLYASLSSSLGIFSDYSIYSISLTDINKDGAYEYIYSYVYSTSLSSIVPKRGIEMYDLATKKHSNLILKDSFDNHIVTYSTNDEFCHIYSAKIEGDEQNGKIVVQEKLGEVKCSSEKGFYYESVAKK